LGHNNSFLNNECSFNVKNGIKLISTSNNSISNCEIFGNSVGISFFDSYSGSSFGNIIQWNEIYNNSEFGISALNNSGVQVDASFNYWGHNSGPFNKDLNPDGQGDNVSKNVNFTPWLYSDLSIAELPLDDDEPSPSRPPFFPIFIITIGIIGMSGLSFLREDLRYLLLSLLTLPLYTKLEKDDILDQPKRQEIFSYIVNKPGSNLTRLHKVLPVGYGTLVHHLSILEREKHIRSRKEMGRKMFYPTGVDWTAKKETESMCLRLSVLMGNNALQ